MSDLYNVLTRFDANLLVALDALLSERQVTRAAERMFVSQPTMSGMLQRLRGQFDDALLVRSGRDMELTTKARALQAPVRELLVGMRALMAAAPDFEPASAKREFRIIMSDYCTSVFLPRLVKAVGAAAPNVSLAVEGIGPSSFQRLVAGDVDLCLTSDDWRVVDSGPGTDDLSSLVVFTEDFVAVACAHNDSAGDGMSLEAFCAAPHVLSHFGVGARTLEELSVAKAGLRYFAQVSVPSFSAVAELIPGTGCLALLQRRLALKASGLKAFAPPLAVPDLREALMWHARYDFDPGHAWMRQLIITAGREIDAPA